MIDLDFKPGPECVENSQELRWRLAFAVDCSQGIFGESILTCFKHIIPLKCQFLRVAMNYFISDIYPQRTHNF